jgi:small subunit ribosomal protein S18
MKFTYKDPQTLEKYIDRQGTILPRAKTGLRNKEQKRLAKEIKRARHLAMLKFTQTL